jgi:hypothetical protein
VSTASAVELAICPHPTSQASASIGGGAGSGIVAVACADGDGAIGAHVARQAGAAEVAVDTRHAAQPADSLVEGAQVATVDVVHKLTHRAIRPAEVRVANTLPKGAQSIPIAVSITAAIQLQTGCKTLLLEVVTNSQPFGGGVETFIDVLEEPPAAVLRVMYRVCVVIDQCN